MIKTNSNLKVRSIMKYIALLEGINISDKITIRTANTLKKILEICKR